MSLLVEVWYATAMSEEILPGGNTDGAVRIGDVVHKRASPWTPTVHALLRHLEHAGMDGVPRALGFDEQGRQMLTYLPGEVIGDSIPWPAWAYADSTLVQVGQWMRRIHDATADFMPPKDERWFTGRTMRLGWIVGHQDAAPYNAVMDGDRLVGFFDWDTASPSSRDAGRQASSAAWLMLAIGPRSRCCPSRAALSSPRCTPRRCRATSGRLSAGPRGAASTRERP
jgi:hypothetical protein